MKFYKIKIRHQTTEVSMFKTEKHSYSSQTAVFDTKISAIWRLISFVHYRKGKDICSFKIIIKCNLGSIIQRIHEIARKVLIYDILFSTVFGVDFLNMVYKNVRWVIKRFRTCYKRFFAPFVREPPFESFKGSYHILCILGYSVY